ncbi:Os07g0650451 [Oryza sativa Japonica Group]|uniref:Os07g0650451 protein n=1 Tax=Oryza sativa subsp. japonica TaxID=39947 RepID=A0A0P0X9U3_ORYSJ|nr:hypothetical protein EE612_041064 [Oryza sativa]BAT02959.1 Os07g0650451 [Oryza sativa Japonica Group]
MQFCSWMWAEQVCVSGRLSVPSTGSCLCFGSSSGFLIASGLSSWLFAVLRMGSCLSSCSSSTCRSGFPFLSLALVSRSADTSCSAVGTVMIWRSFASSAVTLAAYNLTVVLFGLVQPNILIILSMVFVEVMSLSRIRTLVISFSRRLCIS